MKAGVVTMTKPNGEIHPLALEIGEPNGRRDFKVDIWMLLVELESRGSSHLDANEGATLIANVRSPKEVVLLLTARDNISKPAWMSGSIRAPASESETDRLVRSNSLVPSNSSSARICWLTAPGVACSSSAALLKLN